MPWMFEEFIYSALIASDLDLNERER